MLPEAAAAAVLEVGVGGGGGSKQHQIRQPSAMAEFMAVARGADVDTLIAKAFDFRFKSVRVLLARWSGKILADKRGRCKKGGGCKKEEKLEEVEGKKKGVRASARPASAISEPGSVNVSDMLAHYHPPPFFNPNQSNTPPFPRQS